MEKKVQAMKILVYTSTVLARTVNGMPLLLPNMVNLSLSLMESKGKLTMPGEVYFSLPQTANMSSMVIREVGTGF